MLISNFKLKRLKVTIESIIRNIISDLFYILKIHFILFSLMRLRIVV